MSGILKSTRMWIDGTTFNIKDPKIGNEATESEKEEHFKLFNISSDANGVSSTSFKLPNEYCKKLYNDKNFTIHRFQNVTKTKLLLPKYGENGNVSITGDSYDCVASAREELHTLVGEIRNKCPPLQFISIPTLSEDIKSKFLQFKKDILLQNETAPMEGVEESIFQKSEKLHLTIVLFSLLDITEQNEAINLLNNCKKEIICPLIKDKDLIKIKLTGVHCMNEDGNTKKVNVLYSNAQFENENEEFNLQKLANDIQEFFYKKGLVRYPTDNVKIHVTFMNTKYRKVHNKGKKRWIKRIPFDASYILNKYKNYDFGESAFDTVNLSLMASVGDDGFYKSLATVKL